MDRKPAYKQSGPPIAGKDRRRNQVSTLTKDRREALLRSKRLRREPESVDASGATAAADAAPGQNSAAEVQHAVAALQQERRVGSPAHLEALRHLRRLLSTDDQLPCRAAVAAGAVPLLVNALQPASAASEAASAAVTALEAAWALTNLAAADHEVAQSVLPAAPALILHLGGGSGMPVAQQAAWALGNLAGDCTEFRGLLVANGVLAPLAGLATAPTVRGAMPTGTDLAAAATGAWALSNVVKGAGPEVGQLLATPGVTEGLVRLLQHRDDTALASEAAWVMTYLTAASEGHLERLVQAGLVPPLVERLTGGQQAVPNQAAAETADRALLTPVLRTVGNVAAGGGAAAVSQLLDQHSGTLRSIVSCLEAKCAAVPALLRCMQSPHRGLAKEAAWAVSNIAGSPGRLGANALLAAGGATVITNTLKEAAFDIRKEAAYAVANLCAGGGGGTGDAAALTAMVGQDRKALEAMLDLMRAPDMEAALLGVQFAEMVLRVMPRGPQAVEAADGIDALESLQFRGHSDVQQLAADLVDRYFGEDYGLDE